VRVVTIDPHRASPTARLTPLGGPTVLIELGGVRLLTDPTFDAPQTYTVGSGELTKTMMPALAAAAVGPVDAVLLSHDQHPDNLDESGREFLETVPVVVSTPTAAGRLGGRCLGLEPWATVRLADVTVTAVPAVHGPEGTSDVLGPVTGFLVALDAADPIYVTGDNTSLAAVREIASRVPRLAAAVLSAGAARLPFIAGELTMTAERAAQAALILGRPPVLLAHTDGWSHLTESRTAVAAAFAQAGIRTTLLDAKQGTAVSVPLGRKER